MDDDTNDWQICLLLVTVTAVVTATLVLLVVIMLGAALAFTEGTTIGTPVVAVFDGSRSSADSPTVTITTSWVGMGVSLLLLSLPFPLWFVVLRRQTSPSLCDQ
ncbi:hypothetical protein [Frigoribacterium sp. VKM Ac-2530]|uniref:hypothetical protein n=1 Tax=Frigoribacterium sp. VKM Ac-2530 TaxID=2783822 RepID=UPI00188AA951|nr:hypothetical protein [Frigoribacterium sp. VKM Ac-2530]MBF4578760.1 hypothetical protein [Frigoribacterium sp. VKM Ac-2530]